MTAAYREQEDPVTRWRRQLSDRLARALWQEFNAGSTDPAAVDGALEWLARHPEDEGKGKDASTRPERLEALGRPS